MEEKSDVSSRGEIEWVGGSFAVGKDFKAFKGSKAVSSEANVCREAWGVLGRALDDVGVDSNGESDVKRR